MRAREQVLVEELDDLSRIHPEFIGFRKAKNKFYAEKNNLSQNKARTQASIQPCQILSR
jgi:hypothetical protein